MPQGLDNSEKNPIYTVTIRGQTYQTTVSDLYTPLFLALINLNSPKIDSIFSTLQIHISLNGKSVFPYDRTPIFDRVINCTSRFLRRLPHLKRGAETGEGPDQKNQASVERSGHQTKKRRGNKKGEN